MGGGGGAAQVPKRREADDKLNQSDGLDRVRVCRVINPLRGDFDNQGSCEVAQ